MRALPGLFVSFEGGDGTGKSTQVRLLADALTAAGHAVVCTFEPGGTELGQMLRTALLHGEDIDARTEALLFAADRTHHATTVIRPALERGDIVLTDRYLDSSVAYQSGGRGLPPDEVEELSLWGTGGLVPDLTFLLDLDPQIGLDRLTGTPDRLESAEDGFHHRLRQAFLDRAAAHPERIIVLDASGDRDELAGQILARVSAALEQR